MNNPLAGTDPSGYRSICRTAVNCQTIQVNQDQARDSALFNNMNKALDNGASKGQSAGKSLTISTSSAISSISSQASVAGAGRSDAENNRLRTYANSIYKSKCVVNESCSNGINTWGLNSEEIQNQTNIYNLLETDDELYDVEKGKQLLEGVRKANHPIIIAKYPGSNAAIRIDIKNASIEGVGSPVVVLVDPKTFNQLKFQGVKNGIEGLNAITGAEVYGHEFYHAFKMVNGTFNPNRAGNSKYETKRIWEINAVDAMNKIRKSWQRTVY
jgi:hypothetical protein